MFSLSYLLGYQEHVIFGKTYKRVILSNTASSLQSISLFVEQTGTGSFLLHPRYFPLKKC